MELAEAYVSVKLELKDLTRQLTQMRSSLDTHFDNIEKQARRTGLVAMAAFSAGIAGGATLLTRSFISASVNMERMINGLKSVAGSSAAAEKQLIDLREVAKLPGLGLPEAMKGSIALQSVRMEAGKAKEVLIQFGNALAIAGRGREDLEGVIRQLTQMKGKGKVMEEELKIIYERLPSLRSSMMDLGFTTAEAFNKSGKSVDEFINMALAGLSKLPRVAGGTANAIENMKDAWFQLKVTLGDVLLPTFAKIVDKLSGIIEWVNKLSNTQKQWLSWGIVAAGAVATLATGLSALSIAIPSIVSGVKLLGVAFTGLGGAVGIASLALVDIGLILWATKRIYDALTKSIDNVKVAMEEGSRITIMQKHAYAYLNKEAQDLFDQGLDPATTKIKDTNASITRLSKLIFNSTDAFHKNKIEIMTVAEAMKLLDTRMGRAGKVLGPPTPETIPGAEKPPVIDTTAFTELSGLIEAQSRLRMALIGTIGDQYERERKEALETYRLEVALSKDKIAGINAELAVARKKLETPAEIAAAEAQAAVDIKTTQTELLAAYQEYLKKRGERGESYKKQAEDIKKREEELLKNIELKEKEKLAIKEVSRLALFQLAVRTAEEDFSIMTTAYQADKTERDKQRQERLDAEKKQKNEIEKIWAGYKPKDAGGGIKRVDIQSSTDLDPALKEWTDFYTTVSEEDKAFYEQMTINHKAWGLMSLEELKAVKNAWNTAGKEIGTGWKAALVQMELDTVNFSDLFYNATTQIRDALSDTFVGMFDMSKDFIENWKSFALTFKNIMLKAIMDILAAEVTKQLSLLLLSGGGNIWAVGAVLGIFGAAAIFGGGSERKRTTEERWPTEHIGNTQKTSAELTDIYGTNKPFGQYAMGGIIKGGLQIPKLAGGGIYRSPTLAIIGEGHNDEAVIPLKGGKVPVEMRGGGGSITIQNFTLSLPNMSLENIDSMRLQTFVNRQLAPALKQAAASGYLNKAIA